MRIRHQLALTIAAVVAPIACLAIVSLVALQHVQREAELRLVGERVSALRLALDTEITATVRVLRTFGDAPAGAPVQVPTAPPTQNGGGGDGAEPGHDPRLTRLLQGNPLWAAITLRSADGTVLAQARQDGGGPDPAADIAQRAVVADGDEPVFSDLLPAGPGRYVTVIAVPLRRGPQRLVVSVTIAQQAWLALLRRHPIVEGATLTLSDRSSRIIARTLNNEQWVGKPSHPDFWRHTIGRDQGRFVARGMEEQTFYSAFSRLRTSGWILGTGVPSERVDAGVMVPASLTLVGLVIAVGCAVLLAVVLSRRLTQSMQRLADAATGHAAPSPPLALAEAEEVRRLMQATLGNEARARAEAERASRAKDEFLAMLAHELRNPLSAIRSAITLLELERTTPDMQRRAREVLSRQTGHMTTLINEMLDAARLTTGKVTLDRRPVDLAACARRVIEAFSAAGRTQHLRLQVDLAPAPVSGDETRLEQVIANLLDNAAKYTPDGRAVRLCVAHDGAEAVLTIEDDGSGIAAELLPHVFDPFSQAERTLDRSQGGLGLGLTVVRGLVELHGGRVEAHSAGPGRGARFVVRLPTLAADGARSDALASAAPILPPQRIVLVEDNLDSQEMVAAVLRSAGHVVSCASDGEAGIVLARQQAPEVALVDLGLPGTDGLQVARRLRELPALRDTVLLALTGYGDPGTRRLAGDAGFDAFLQKPFDAAAFADAVRAVRARRA